VLEKSRHHAKRPAIMRMKDSDDYITARAANPWTGVVSPSVGSPSPCTPCTPDSPGDALKLLPRAQPSSPTPEARTVPVVAATKANEGRKVSAGAMHTWRAEEKGWVSQKAVSAASPRETATVAGAALSRSQPTLRDDQFVFPMPSAWEPQPYNYPDRTVAEIEAFEHYQRKTRRVGDERYDERLHGKASGGIRKTSGGRGYGNSRPTQDGTAFRVYGAAPSPITVAKEAGRDYCIAGAELKAATFAPFSSPRTPDLKAEVPTAILKPMGAFRDDSPGAVGNLRFKDLRQLPRVRLVHPELASLPPFHAQRQRYEANRKCSLGCDKGRGSGECGRTPFSGQTLFWPISQGQHIRSTKSAYIVSTLSSLLESIMAVTGNPQLLRTLRDSNATSKQKIAATKSLLLAIGQVSAVLMAVAMAWRLGAAILHVVEVLLWPFAVPFKILGYFLG